MFRKFACLSGVLLLSAMACAVGACASPTLPGGGNASGQDTSGKTGALDTQITFQQPGAIGGGNNTKLAYEKQATNPQSAPTLQLNLQPGAGATTAASYPALATISQVFLVVMANGQVEPSLNEGQIAAVASALEKAGVAASGVIGAQPKPPVVAPPK